jgi:hypothetical protein
MFNFGWEQIYLSIDFEEFLKKQNLLREAGVSFKTKIQNNSIRLSMNNLDGRTAALSRGGPPIRDYYKIFVKKEDSDYAKHIINT